LLVTPAFAGVTLKKLQRKETTDAFIRAEGASTLIGVHLRSSAVSFPSL
jgi:hypothetical protein